MKAALPRRNDDLQDLQSQVQDQVSAACEQHLVVKCLLPYTCQQGDAALCYLLSEGNDLRLLACAHLPQSISLMCSDLFLCPSFLCKQGEFMLCKGQKP